MHRKQQYETGKQKWIQYVNILAVPRKNRAQPKKTKQI